MRPMEEDDEIIDNNISENKLDETFKHINRVNNSKSPMREATMINNLVN